MDEIATILCEVDGEAGRLIVRGHPVEELATHTTFEQMAALLWEGFEPPIDFPVARRIAFEQMAPVFDMAANRIGIEGLRCCLSFLREEALCPLHILTTAAVPVAMAALHRRRLGLSPVHPSGAGQARDFLRMMRGEEAAEAEVSALEAYLVTVAEHGMNASTFTARVIASTYHKSPPGLLAAVLGALGALQGPLHGGAPGPVLDMLDAIGSIDRADAWIDGQLASGQRIMGFGHRIYRVRDPRADVLRGVVERLQQGSPRLQFARAVEVKILQALHRHKPDLRLQTNVEYYTALVLEALRLPRELFTSVFAMGRVLGWCAHIFEQWQSGRLIRPPSRYVGPQPVAR